jgi:translocation and assembly module TamB
VAVKGRVDLLGPSSVEVSAQDLNPDFLRPFVQLDRALQGRLNFTLQFSGPMNDPKAGVSLEAFDAGVEGVQADRISALAYYSAGTLHIEQGLISKGPHKLVAIGTLPVDPRTFTLDARGPLQLQLRLQDADLSFLSILTPQITDASGTVAGEVNVAGTIAVPQMTGFLRSSGGRLRYAPLRTPIEDLHIDVAFSQDQIEVQDISAAIGQGRVAANGVVGITDFRPGSVRLALRAEHATLDLPGVYSGQVDAEITLSGQARQPTVSGQLALSNGRISPGGSVGAGDAPNLGFNGTLEAGPNTVFSGGPVRAQVEGAVHVGGTLAHPLASGDVTTPGGEFAFLGSAFRVTGGSAAFSESRGVEPQISAHAQRVVGDYIVIIDICGLATQLRVCHITSIPPLPEADVYALVAADAGIVGDPESVVGQGLGRSLLGSICEPLHLSECAVAYSRESPVTLRMGGFLLQNVYLRLSEVWTGPTTPTTSLTLGTFPRPIPIGQSYTVAGLEYYLSPNVLATLKVDTLGGNGIFLLNQFPL